MAAVRLGIRISNQSKLNMIKKIATFGGLSLIVLGLIGLCAPSWIGIQPSVFHNLVHLVSGAAALYFGLKL